MNVEYWNIPDNYIKKMILNVFNNIDQSLMNLALDVSY